MLEVRMEVTPAVFGEREKPEGWGVVTAGVRQESGELTKKPEYWTIIGSTTVSSLTGPM